MSLLRSSRGQASVSYLVLTVAIALAAAFGTQRLGVGLETAINARADSDVQSRRLPQPAIASTSQAAGGTAARVFLDLAQTAKQLEHAAANAGSKLEVPNRVPGATPTTNPTKFKIVLENEEAHHLSAIHARLLEGTHSATDGPANKHFELVQPELVMPRDFEHDFSQAFSTSGFAAGGVVLDKLAALTSFYHQTNLFNAIEELMGVSIEQIHGRPVKLRPTAFDGFNAYYSPKDGEIVHGKARRAVPIEENKSTPPLPAGIETLVQDEYVRMANGLDVPSHEAYHLYRHGIAPDWPRRDMQSRGHGEFGGDLSSLFMTTRDPAFRTAILKETGGDLSKDSALSRLGVAVSVGTGSGPGGMRNSLNSLSMSEVSSTSPHDLSKPLSGAAYESFVAAYNSLRRDYAAHAEDVVKRNADELAMINAGRLMFWVHDTSVRKLAQTRPSLRYHELVDEMASVARSPAHGFGEAGKSLASTLIESAKRRGIVDKMGGQGPDPSSAKGSVAIPDADKPFTAISRDGQKRPMAPEDVFSYAPLEAK